jgi:hypothetical protein
MCAVEAGPGSVILVGTQDDNGMIRKWQGEGVDVRVVEGETDHRDTMRLKKSNDVGDRPWRQSPHLPYPSRSLFDLHSFRL